MYHIHRYGEFCTIPFSVFITAEGCKTPFGKIWCFNICSYSYTWIVLPTQNILHWGSRMCCGDLGNDLIRPHAIEGCFRSRVLRKFSGNCISAAFRLCPFCNMKMSVAAAWRSTSTLQRNGTGIFLIKMDRKRWTGGRLGPISVSFFNHSGFLSEGFHEGEPEARHQLPSVSETTTVAQCSLMMSISNLCCNTQNNWVYVVILKITGFMDFVHNSELMDQVHKPRVSECYAIIRTL
jgi:hypothetical protein